MPIYIIQNQAVMKFIDEHFLRGRFWPIEQEKKLKLVREKSKRKCYKELEKKVGE